MLALTGDQTSSGLPTNMDFLAQQIAGIEGRVAAACLRVGRRADEVKIVAVTKTQPVQMARKAYALGLVRFGENRVQEAFEKYKDGWLSEGSPRGYLQLIGHLQSNKVRKAVQLFDSIDTVDCEDLARHLSGECVRSGRILRVLLEVNTSKEAQKWGISPGNVLALADTVAALPGLQLSGLMTVGPVTEVTEQIQASFGELKQLFDQIGNQLKLPGWSVLSMGMSGDFELAIEAGATEIRLGTALFGVRKS